MATARRIRIPAGSLTHWEGEPAPFLELVISGVVRVFVTAPDGRTMTIRYCRPGALIGAASLFASPYAMPAPTQALVDAEMLRMSPTRARRAAERDLRVARALLGELSERVLSFVSEFSGSAFSTVRQRVARHLLDLASERLPEPASGPTVGVRACRQGQPARTGGRRRYSSGSGGPGPARAAPGRNRPDRTRPDRDRRSRSAHPGAWVEPRFLTRPGPPSTLRP